MKTISDILRREPVWVNPTHRVESAIWLLRGHDTGGLPVLDGTKLVGMVLHKHLLGVDGRRQVQEVMERSVSAVTPEMSVREAADLMARESLERLPVIAADGTLLGVIASSDLLTELRRSTDPLTELPWSDSMREWAVEKLRAGREITLLFIDLNDFGQFNKQYGHVVGDTVLRNVANVLRDLTDPALEMVCRYGGDEFCIATLRSAAEAGEMASTIEREVQQLRIVEARGQSIGLCIGLRGGRRTREREHIHYASTLNNLINLASRDCMLRKSGQHNAEAPGKTEGIALEGESGSLEEGEEAPVSLEAEKMDEVAGEMEASENPGEILRLAQLDVTWDGRNAHARVALENRSRPAGELERDGTAESLSGSAETPSVLTTTFVSYTGEAHGQTDKEGLARVAAEATMAALRSALPPGYDARLEEVLSVQTLDGRTLVSVVGHFRTPSDTRPVAGSAFVKTDIHRAVASAVLAATNRQMERALRSADLSYAYPTS